jgi:hypothetical protein
MIAEQACRDLVILAAKLTDAKDHKGFAALFADDGVLVRPGAPALQGYQAILDSYRTRPSERITRHLISNTRALRISAFQASGAPIQTSQNPCRLGPSLSVEQFQQLCDVPPEAQWFANLDSDQTRRAYRGGIEAFGRFTGIRRPEDFRAITRGHVLAWRSDLE